MGEERVKVAGVMMSREEAAEVEAARRHKYGPFVLPSLMISITLVVVMSALVVLSVGWLPSHLAVRVVMLVVPVLIVLWVLLDYRRKSRRLRKQRLEMMRYLGWRICIKCEYDLGQSRSPVCPECGSRYPTLALANDEQHD